MSLGDAYIDVHADTSPFQRDLNTDVPRIAHESDSAMEAIGEGWGRNLSEGTRSELRRQMPHILREFENGARAVRIRLGDQNFLLDRRGGLRDLGGRFVQMFQDEAERAFARATGPDGFFSRIGESIADAVGSAANVSSKSPLITLLIPAFGALGGLITAAVQAVNGLAAVLVEIPGLLAAIGLQVATLMFAFHGLGSAIQGAFSATNAEELQKAIQNLTPAAQDFVKSLLPMRDFFKAIQYLVQQNFFTALGDSLTKAFSALGPVLYRGLPELATALGTLFGELAQFFGSPAFVKFVSDIIPATLSWLGKFGPQFVSFLTAVVNMADAAIPGLTRLGDILNSAFAMFTSWLNDQIASGNLTKWLEDMGDTLESVKNLFFSASAFVVSFLDALNKGGGNDVIDQFTELFEQLSMFFSSPAGQAAMQGFVHTVEALTYAFSGLVFVLLGLFIGLESILQFFGFIGDAFVKFIDWLTNTAGPAIGTFFTETLPGFFESFWKDVTDLWDKITYYIQSGWGAMVQWVKDTWKGFTDWIGEKVDAVVNFFTSIPDRLADIGRSIMQGLKDGLQWGWDHTVGPLLTWITNAIPDWKGPKEKDMKLLQPSGKAVMQGFGIGVEAGAKDVMSLLGGITNSIAYQANAGPAIFNTNLNFMGQQPSPQEARAAGSAVASELNRQVASRDIALAVRMA